MISQNTLLRHLVGPQDRKTRLADQDGAHTIQVLASFIPITMIILLIIQITIVFLNSIMVSHALGLASAEASARGGVDSTVQAVFRNHIPAKLRDQCDARVGGSCLSDPTHAGLTAGATITPGSALERRNADIMTLRVNYIQDIGLLQIMGFDASFPVQREVKVASQSAKEN